MTTTTNLEIANRIADQIGQPAFAMMGTTRKMGDERSLSFDIKGSRWHLCKVTLELDDTYTVRFYRFPRKGTRMADPVELDRIEASELVRCIEAQTGLYLSL